MADGICDYGDEPHGRNWILTRLNPPISLELCDEHSPVGLLYLAAAELGMDGNEFYGKVVKIVDQAAAKAEKDLKAAQAAQAASDPNAPDDPGRGFDQPDPGGPVADGDVQAHEPIQEGDVA
jgi:hypothetical protein